jgi:hypothetical protein
MHNSNKMVTCTFCRIREYNYNISRYEYIFKKWRKDRDPSVTIKNPKVKISVLIMHRHKQMVTGAEGNKKP